MTATTMIAAPMAITLQVEVETGSGSMSLVAPNGVTMLDAQQPTAATTAATTVMLAACIVTASAIDRLDRPRAPQRGKIGVVGPKRASYRLCSEVHRRDEEDRRQQPDCHDLWPQSLIFVPRRVGERRVLQWILLSARRDRRRVSLEGGLIRRTVSQTDVVDEVEANLVVCSPRTRGRGRPAVPVPPCHRAVRPAAGRHRRSSGAMARPWSDQHCPLRPGRSSGRAGSNRSRRRSTTLPRRWLPG